MKKRLEVEGKKRKIEKQIHQYCRINPITCCVLNTISGNPRKQQGKKYTYPKIKLVDGERWKRKRER